MARLRQLVINLALTLFALAVVGAAIEATARIMVKAAEPPDPGRPISRYHPKWGWDKPPGGEMRIARDEFDVVISINSKGLRGPERDYEKPSETRRILILGDSFAEGYYVNEEESVRAVLEKAVSRPETCGPVEVIGGGTAGYSTDQELLFFQDEGHRYTPDLVLVFFYYNDLYYNTTGTGTGGKPKPYFDVDGTRLLLRNVPVPRLPGDETRVGRGRPWRGSIALRMLSDRTARGNPRVHDVLATIGLVEPVSREPFREFWPYASGQRPEVEDMWRRTAVILKALKEEVKGRGGRLAVVYVPSRLEANDDVLRATDARHRLGIARSPSRIPRRLKATCEAIGIGFLDPREALRRSEATGTPAYFPGDGHWNVIGNAIVAHELVPFVRSILGCR